MRLFHESQLNYFLRILSLKYKESDTFIFLKCFSSFEIYFNSVKRIVYIKAIVKK